MTPKPPHSDNPALARDERDDLLLRVALAERKLALTAQKLQVRTQELSAIHRLSETIGSERQIDRLCERTAEEICRTLGAAAVCILLLDEHTGDLVTTASAGNVILGGSRPRIKTGDGLLWQVLKTGKPLHLPGSAAAEQFAGNTVGAAGIAVPIRTKDKTLGVIYAGGRTSGKEFGSRERDLLCGIANQAAVALDNATLVHDLENLFVGIAWSFASALDAKSPWTAGHSKRVTLYAVSIAEELDISPDFVQSVQTSGLLHDIGKIAIPERILDKPGAITKEEHLTICEHATQGAKILEHIDTFQPFIPGVKHHHEWWNGSGFPDGLERDEIPLLARVLTVADSFDAITSDRPYRERRSRNDAIAEIQRCAGSQFDPIVVDAFVACASRAVF